MVKKKTNKLIFKMPKDLDDINRRITDIARTEREIEKVKARLEADIEKLKLSANKKIKPLRKKISALGGSIFFFANMNRKELVARFKRKMVKLLSGIIGWRKAPDSVYVKSQAEAVKELEENGLDEFVRVTKEVNKQKILSSPSVVRDLATIKVRQGPEEFYVNINAVDLELTRKIRRFKPGGPMERGAKKK